MIGNISTSGSFSAETGYEMRNKKDQPHQYEKLEAEVIKPTHIDSTVAPATAGDGQQATTKNISDKKQYGAESENENENENIEIKDGAVKKSATGVPPFGDGERHRILATNIAADAPPEFARIFKAVAEQNPNISKPAVKISVSADKRDAVDPQQWIAIGKNTLKELGYENSPFLIVQHRDREHDHIHILTSKVDFCGATVSNSNDKHKLEKVMRETEEKYDFQKTEASRETLRSAPTRREIEHYNKTREVPLKIKLQVKIDGALEESKTVPEFVAALQKRDVGILSYINKSNEATGISFYTAGEKPISGTSLGNGFRWGGLQERGLEYQPTADLQILKSATAECEEKMRGFRQTAKNSEIENNCQPYNLENQPEHQLSDEAISRRADDENNYYDALRERNLRALNQYDDQKFIRDLELLQSQQEYFETNIIKPGVENVAQNLLEPAQNFQGYSDAVNLISDQTEFAAGSGQNTNPEAENSLLALQNAAKSFCQNPIANSTAELGDSVNNLAAIVEMYFAELPEADTSEANENLKKVETAADDETINQQNKIQSVYLEDYDEDEFDQDDMEDFDMEFSFGGMSM